MDPREVPLGAMEPPELALGAMEPPEEGPSSRAQLLRAKNSAAQSEKRK